MFNFHPERTPYSSSPLKDRQHDEEEDYSSENNSPQKGKKKPVPFFLFVASLAIVIAGTASLILSSVHFISETEDAVITCFGNPRTVSQSGPCFTIPFIEVFNTVDKTIQGMIVGYTVEDDATISKEATMITEDFNFLDIFFYLEWQVSDPVKYLYASLKPEVILSNLFQSSIRDTVGLYSADDVLTTSRDEIQDKVTQTLAATLEELDLGIIVLRATIQDVEFPTEEIKSAFDAVEAAKSSVNTKLSAANEQYSIKTEAATADADELIQNAEAEKTQRINEAEGQVARFKSMYEQYVLAPEVTKLRMYYEAMEEILPNVKVIVTNGSGEIVNVFTEPYSSSSQTNPSSSGDSGTSTSGTTTPSSSSDSSTSTSSTTTPAATE